MNKLTIKTKLGEIMGNIIWTNPEFKTNYETDELSDVKVVKIIWVDVEKKFQGRGIASLLIISMISQINYTKKLEITLDDCSDKSGTKECIYYKLGFRHLSDATGEMSIFIKHAPNDQGYTYENESEPTSINSFQNLNLLLNQFKARELKDYDFIFKLNSNVNKPEIDITEAIKRRLKTLNLIDYHKRTKFGKSARSVSVNVNSFKLKKTLKDIVYLINLKN